MASQNSLYRKKRKFKASPDVSVMSNSTYSMININDAEAEIEERELVIDFTKVNKPVLKQVFIEGKFFVTHFGNEFAKMGIKQFDIILKINGQDLTTMNKEDGQILIDNILIEKW